MANQPIQSALPPPPVKEPAFTAVPLITQKEEVEASTSTEASVPKTTVVPAKKSAKAEVGPKSQTSAHDDRKKLKGRARAAKSRLQEQQSQVV